MSLTAEIREYARSQGAQLVGIAAVDVYTEYAVEVERRFQETGAQLESVPAELHKYVTWA